MAPCHLVQNCLSFWNINLFIFKTLFVSLSRQIGNLKNSFLYPKMSLVLSPSPSLSPTTTLLELQNLYQAHLGEGVGLRAWFSYISWFIFNHHRHQNHPRLCALMMHSWRRVCGVSFWGLLPSLSLLPLTLPATTLTLQKEQTMDNIKAAPFAILYNTTQYFIDNSSWGPFSANLQHTYYTPSTPTLKPV